MVIKISQFKNFYKDQGIIWHFTAPHNPQQNSVAKLMNKTLLGRVVAC